MDLKLGVIADDFTGATDIASFLVLNGLTTVQLCGVSSSTPLPDAEAIVISHKSRSCSREEAIASTQASLDWLLKNNCQKIYFKYCSTFDSTEKGNIGPVTDSLMKRLNVNFTIFSPALPINDRTVYKGYLFAGDVLLSESGMRHHPLTPMTDSSVKRLVEKQSEGICGIVTLDIVRKGADAVKMRLLELKQSGCSYAVIDAVENSDLLVQGEAVADMKFVTGGSGLAIGIAHVLREANSDTQSAQKLGYPQGRFAAIFSGSCSVMTNKQVDFYKEVAASKLVDVNQIMQSKRLEEVLPEYIDFYIEHQNDELSPLFYATPKPEELDLIQKKYGVEASSQAVEQFFAGLATALYEKGVRRFIVAGGETSSIVTQALKVDGFYIGPTVAPGVPWVRSVNSDISLTLKSGNFGADDFFLKAQKDFPI